MAWSLRGAAAASFVVEQFGVPVAPAALHSDFRWLALLAAFDLIFIVVCFIVFDFVVEE